MGQAKTSTKQLNELLWSARITKHNNIRKYDTIDLCEAELWEVN